MKAIVIATDEDLWNCCIEWALQNGDVVIVTDANEDECIIDDGWAEIVVPREFLEFVT